MQSLCFAMNTLAVNGGEFVLWSRPSSGRGRQLETIPRRVHYDADCNDTDGQCVTLDYHAVSLHHTTRLYYVSSVAQFASLTPLLMVNDTLV